MKRFYSRLPVWVTDYLGMAGALGLLLGIFGFTADNFFSRSTFLIIADQVPDITILAVGMTFVLIIAGIDLSVGSVMGFSGAVIGVLLVKSGQPIGLGIMAGLFVGLGCGLLNGLVVIKWSLPSFIVTLGMMEVARGAALRVTQSRTIYIPGYLDFITETRWLGISMPFILAVCIVLLAQFVLSHTVFGRYMVAIGTNEEAVRLSGINPKPVKLAVFSLSGLLAGLASIIHTARYQANPNNGQGVELQVIAAVVIGGTSLMGGRGSVLSTFFGVLIISVLETGLAQANAQESTKRLITGAVIVAAVILDYYRQRIRNVKTR
ncbi:MAG: ABC transporter permease [Sedimentisphaerales bacterium]|nr:ABC transporter permease [Sedimentisphaerales bacterium]